MKNKKFSSPAKSQQFDPFNTKFVNSKKKCLE